MRQSLKVCYLFDVFHVQVQFGPLFLLEYLKTQASKGIYENIFKLLNEKARQLKIEVKKDFAVKPEIVLPTIVDAAASAGNFAVTIIFKKF